MKTEWDFSHLLYDNDEKNFEAKRTEWRAATDAFILKWKDRTDYLEDAAVLKEALDEYEAWCAEWGTDANERAYYHLYASVREHDTTIKAKKNLVDEFAKKIGNDLRFFMLRLSRIPLETQHRFLSDVELKPYHHYLERLFAESPYFLSEKEETIMSLKGGPARTAWTKMRSAFLSKEEREVLLEDGTRSVKSFSEILGLLSSDVKEVRDGAAAAFNDILATHVDMAENELNAVLANKKIDDELRGYSRADEARHVSDDIETDVVDTLLATTAEHLDIPAAFYELKAQLLGLETLAYHERNVSVGHANKKMTYEESVALVKKAFGSLDSEFLAIFEDFLEKGLIDAFPRKGKRSGAFCSPGLKSQPVYVMLNHTDRLKDVATIAHEMGHAINFELSRRAHHALDYDLALSTAEVASTFMEDFVLEELMKDADDEMCLALMMEKLNDDVSSIFRQIRCYAFEQELHTAFREKGYLSKEEIGAMFQKYMREYMGDFVEQSPGSENWWVYWGHIRNFFYNYSYASGLLISKALQRKVREDPAFISEVKEFLSAGTSASPKEIFSRMGIDISSKAFWEEGIAEIRDLLSEAQALAKKLGKM